MVQDLKEIIDHLNTTNTSQDNADPVSSKYYASIYNAYVGLYEQSFQ